MPPREKISTERRSDCPIAGALDVVGDRWTLLVLRDLFRGKQRYGEFAESDEGIPTNLLADRLARLEKLGLVTSELYQEKPKRYAYALTAQGRTLKPILRELALWGQQNVAGTQIRKEMAELMGG